MFWEKIPVLDMTASGKILKDLINLFSPEKMNNTTKRRI